MPRSFCNVSHSDARLLHTIIKCWQAYYILDELLVAGEMQEANKLEILEVCHQQDDLMDESKEGKKKKNR